MTEVRLPPDQLEELADLVADRLREDVEPMARIVGAVELAREIGKSPAWIRAHYRELGGWRDGDGPKAPYLLNLAVARERLGEMGERSGAKPQPTPKRRRRPQGSVPLLAVKGEG